MKIRNDHMHDAAPGAAKETSISPLPELGRRKFLRRVGLGAATLAASDLGLHRLAFAGPETSTIIWSKPLEAHTFDPHVAILESEWQLSHMIYDSLTSMDDDLRPVPGVAQSWEQPTPASYVFHLRKGVTFSNGRPMTADDVVGSLERVLDPKTGSFWVKQLGKVTAIKRIDDGTVRVDLAAPYTPFLAALSATMASILPMKELKEGKFDPAKAFLGTGPYMVTEHVQDDHWRLERNPHYWRPGLPKAKDILVRIMPATNAQIASLRDGTVDIATFEASPDAPLLLKGIPNVTVIEQGGSNMYFLALNAVAKDSPFHNEKLRRAIALTLDREMMRNMALGGVGEPTTVMAPAFKACDPAKLPYFRQDIKRAKALLKEAGSEGLRFQLLVRNVPADIQLAQVVKQNIGRIGLTADIAVLDEGIWVKRVWLTNPSDFQATIFWYAGYSDPAMVPLWWNPKLAGFTAGYVPDDAKLDGDIAEALKLSNTDPARKGALQKLCTAVDETANVIPLVTREDTIAYRSDKLKAKITRIEGYGYTLRGIEEYQKI